MTDRRDFIKFLGRSLGGATVGSLLASCASRAPVPTGLSKGFQDAEWLDRLSLEPVVKDELTLATGLSSEVLLIEGQPISKNLFFGANNDYTQFLPFKGQSNDGLLWVNHEAYYPLFVSGFDSKAGGRRTIEQIKKEIQVVGGAIVRIRKGQSGKWELVANDKLNRRITGETRIPFAWNEPIAGSKFAYGMVGNCAGGYTPWGTILTCEENYQDFHGEVKFEDGKRTRTFGRVEFERVLTKTEPEHYGWVVEVNPLSGAAKKLIALGRFAHEGATTWLAPDGRVVVYTADDADQKCLYKFISDKAGSVETGTLYVANFEKGRWVSLAYSEQPVLREKFKDQTEVLIRCREAAALLGGTPLDRPEDVEIDPVSKAVLVTATNSKTKKNYFGHVIKLEEEGSNPLSLNFVSSTFVSGGPQSGLACPDNLAFDRSGNLWLSSDLSGKFIGTEPYKFFGPNALFYIPMSGPKAGTLIRVANAPVDAELTGPCFSPDGRTLFLAVQHPGETSKSLDQLTSRWPTGQVPRSGVVAISGPTLDALVAGPTVAPVTPMPELPLIS